MRAESKAKQMPVICRGSQLHSHEMAPVTLARTKSSGSDKNKSKREVASSLHDLLLALLIVLYHSHDDLSSTGPQLGVRGFQESQ